MTTPIQQLRAYLVDDVERDVIAPEVAILVGMLINLEAEYLLDMKTKAERQQALAALPDKIREEVQRQVMVIWSDTKNRYSDKEIARKSL